MKKYLITCTVLVLQSVAAIAVPSSSTVIDAKRAELVTVLDSAVVQAALIEANQTNHKLTQEQINKADDNWRQYKLGSLLSNEIQKNACSKALIAFQSKNKSFAEIFITDKRGLNVCQTNNTTDYYQADEAWWREAYDNGKGKAYVGKVEFDSSADVTVIPIYEPIKDKNQKVIGVCKALISLY